MLFCSALSAFSFAVASRGDRIHAGLLGLQLLDLGGQVLRVRGQRLVDGGLGLLRRLCQLVEGLHLRDALFVGGLNDRLLGPGGLDRLALGPREQRLGLFVGGGGELLLARQAGVVSPAGIHVSGTWSVAPVRGFFQERSVTFGAGEIVRPISSTSALSSWITPQRQFQPFGG
jgi:hypothetical protein